MTRAMVVALVAALWAAPARGQGTFVNEKQFKALNAPAPAACSPSGAFLDDSGGLLEAAARGDEGSSHLP